MPLTDSRLGPGTLKFDPTGTPTPGPDVSAQAGAVRLTPSVDTTDGTPTLETPEPAPLSTITWALNLDAIQDFDDPAGLVNYLMDNALAEVPFEWVPNTEVGTTPTSFNGTVQILPIEIGGDVGVQVVTSVELPLVGAPTRTDGTPLAASSSSSKSKAAA
jgi:hypothetical protein